MSTLNSLLIKRGSIDSVEMKYLEDTQIRNLTDISQSQSDFSFDYMGMAQNVSLNSHAHSNNYIALVLLLFPLFAISGNMLVVLSVIKQKNLHNITNYLVVSLASSDLFVAAVVMPIAVYALVSNKWSLPIFLCDLWISFDVFGSTASIYNLVAIAVDRFIAVTKPLEYAQHKNSNRIYYMITIVYLISFTIAVPMAVGLNNYPKRVVNECSFNNNTFLIVSSLFSFYVPTISMIALYYKVFKVIRTRIHNPKFGQNKLVVQLRKMSIKKQNERIINPKTTDEYPGVEATEDQIVTERRNSINTNFENDLSISLMNKNKTKRDSNASSDQNKINENKKFKKKLNNFASKKEKKVTKTLAIVLIVYLVCWLPFALANISKGICNELKNFYNIDCSFISENLLTVLTFLGYLNSVLNPIIYTIFNMEFRKAFEKEICCKK